MQFNIQDQTEDASEETKPVAPGTSNSGFCSDTDPCEFSFGSPLDFLL